MKRQTGFVVIMGVAGLIGALLVGTVAAVDYRKTQEVKRLAAAPAAPQAEPEYVGTSLPEPAYEGHRYRTGGHFGEPRSDVALEAAPQAEPEYVGTSTPEPAYEGHRYRTGGHFGEQHSDVALESDRN